MVSRPCGDQSTTNVLHSELDYSTGNIFVVFISLERGTTNFIGLVPS